MRTDIAQAAMDMLRTPFRHQGRQPGAGLDCLGVWVVACQQCDVPIEDVSDYQRMPDPIQLLEEFRKQFTEVKDIEAGDALLICIERSHFARHIAVAISSIEMVHVRYGGVVCRDFIPHRQVRYRFRAVHS